MIALPISIQKVESLSRLMGYALRGVGIQLSFVFGIIVSDLLLIFKANY